jgi:peptidoglycan/LPS O-acetylase OafA/YrhL
LNNIKLVPTLWTIRIEFICSFLLPFLVLLTRRFPRLAPPMVLLLAFFKMNGKCEAANIFTFYLGYLISHAETALAKLSLTQTKWLLSLGLVCFLFGLTTGLHPISENMMLAGLLAILVPCNWPGLRNVLESRPLAFIGRISYSFFLFHLPVFMLTWTWVELFCPKFLSYHNQYVPALVLFVFTAACTIPIASFSEFYVERKWNSVGHRISQKIAAFHL